jgi:uncharacterized membrane-anchored protein
VSRTLRHWLAVLPSMLVVAAVAVRAEWTLRTGHEVRLAVRSYDPMDALSGRYIATPLEIERIELAGVRLPHGPPVPGDDVWIQLEPADPTWRAVALWRRAPGDAEIVALRGTAYLTSPLDVRVDYGLDRFFIPHEGADPSLPRGARVLTAVVRVATDGRGALEDLLVDGEPWESWNARQKR